MRAPNILIMGYGRHGKDTVSEMLSKLCDLKFSSSSCFCAEHVIFEGIKAGRTPELKSLQGKYASAAECFADRHNHRFIWFNAIRNFNRPDPTTLGRAIFKDHDIYCGLRNKAEFHALVNARLIDFTIWVDASDRLSPEDADSCSVEPWMADFTIDNNGTMKDLDFNINLFAKSYL